jgi:hypothetical protein
VYLSEKNMTQQTPEQLRIEAAKQQALADRALASLNAEKVNLSKQQAELRQLQDGVVELGQRSVGATPREQQIFANAIISAQQKISSLQSTIIRTNSRINSLATEATSYQSNANSLLEEASRLIENELRPPVPSPIPVPEATEIQAPVKSVADQFAELPPLEVDIAPPLQSNRIVDPDTGVIIQPLSNITSPRPTPTVPYGPSRDDDGNLLPGWETGELGDQFVGPGYLSQPKLAAPFTSQGLSVNKKAAQGAQSNNNASNQVSKADWRVKLSLADDQAYLYKSPDPGILKPLAATNGVIFPYLPAVIINYIASYDPTDITHSNYKIFSYRQSSVDSISITGDFTAQDTTEANYLLAVIHFFKSVTKMFYGQDQNPKPGTPPPLCYLSGLGAFQFNQHPLVITNFNYSLPTDVDYIRASYYLNDPGDPLPINTPYNPSPRQVRLPQYLKPGGVQGPPQWRTAFPTALEPTYVPTKMQITLQANPIVTRNDISRKFSLKDYASGDFYGGSLGKTNGRGIW